jgi:hypothetical protein
MKKIGIPYFPVALKYCTPLLVAAGIYGWVRGYPIACAIAVVASIVVLTTNYVTEIDLQKKQCRDYLSLFWIPFGNQVIAFNRADRIIIQKERHSQTLNSRSRSRQLNWSSFTGTLILDNEKELELLTTTTKSELVKGLKEFADFLNVAVEDMTAGGQ